MSFLKGPAVKVAAVTGLTLLLLWLWLRSVDLAATGRALREASPGWLALAAAGSLLHLVVRSWRWSRLLGEAGRGAARFRDLVRFTFIGYCVTFVVPGRAGELVRPALLWSRAAAPAGRALMSVLLERLLDVLVLASLMVAFAAADPEAFSPSTLKLAGALAAGLAAATAAIVIGLRRFPALLPRLIHRAARLLPSRLAARAEVFALSVIAGLDALLQPGSWWRLPLMSLLTWAPVAWTCYAGLRATGAPAPWFAPLVLVPLTALGIAVPTPAGIGGYHAAMTWGLTRLFGAPAEVAAAAAVATHAASVLPVIAAGLYSSWREGVSLASLREARRQVGADTTPGGPA